MNSQAVDDGVRFSLATFDFLLPICNEHLNNRGKLDRKKDSTSSKIMNGSNLHQGKKKRRHTTTHKISAVHFHSKGHV